MKRLLASALIAGALALPAVSATMGIWTGPGPRACDGRCPMEWAMEYLSEANQELLRQAIEVRPEPQYIPVLDGTYIALMTYYDKGPVADTGGTMASLAFAEPAFGWELDDNWAFVKIEGCQNWALVRIRPFHVLIEPPATVPAIPTTFVPHQFEPPRFDTPSFFGPPTNTPPGIPPVEPPVVVPAPIPLPAGLWLLITAALSLAVFSRFRRNDSSS